MATEETRQALLVMDVQTSIVDRIADKAQYLEKTGQAVREARQKGILVIFVVVGFRPGLPEISDANQSFAAIKDNATMKMPDPQPALDVEKGDIVVTKRRVSAFTGSDLEVILRAQGVGHLVLSGIATSGVVLSTVREAADKDYRLSVLSDLCVDFDPQVHEVLTAKVFPRQAAVTTSPEWLKTI